MAGETAANPQLELATMSGQRRDGSIRSQSQGHTGSLRSGSLRSQGQSGSIRSQGRNSAARDGTQGSRSQEQNRLLRGQQQGLGRAGEVLETRRQCERDTHFFAALLIVLMVFQVIHAGYMSYRNKLSHRSLGGVRTGGFIAGQILFPLLTLACCVPVTLWLIANGWEFCTHGVWKKLKSKKGYAVFQVFMFLNTGLYISNITFLIARGYNMYLDRIGTDAACYCSDVTDVDLDQTNITFHCQCMVPEETPWHIVTPDVNLIDDWSLQKRGSNYTGHVVVNTYNSSKEVYEQSEAFIPDFKRMLFVTELNIITLPLRVLSWGWTSEYAWRDVNELRTSITSQFLRQQRRNLMDYALFSLLDGIDTFSLISDLFEHARDFTVSRPMANWLMATIAVCSIFTHLFLPIGMVAVFPDYDENEYERSGNKLVSFLRSSDKRMLISHSIAVIINSLLFIVRISLFEKYGGTDGLLMPTLFTLFIMKEFYVIAHKGSEFFIGWWDTKKKN